MFRLFLFKHAVKTAAFKNPFGVRHYLTSAPGVVEFIRNANTPETNRGHRNKHIDRTASVTGFISDGLFKELKPGTPVTPGLILSHAIEQPIFVSTSFSSGISRSFAGEGITFSMMPALFSTSFDVNKTLPSHRKASEQEICTGHVPFYSIKKFEFLQNEDDRHFFRKKVPSMFFMDPQTQLDLERVQRFSDEFYARMENIREAHKVSPEKGKEAFLDYYKDLRDLYRKVRRYIPFDDSNIPDDLRTILQCGKTLDQDIREYLDDFGIPESLKATNQVQQKPQ